MDASVLDEAEGANQPGQCRVIAVAVYMRGVAGRAGGGEPRRTRAGAHDGRGQRLNERSAGAEVLDSGATPGVVHQYLGAQQRETFRCRRMTSPVSAHQPDTPLQLPRRHRAGDANTSSRRSSASQGAGAARHRPRHHADAARRQAPRTEPSACTAVTRNLVWSPRAPRHTVSSGAVSNTQLAGGRACGPPADEHLERAGVNEPSLAHRPEVVAVTGCVPVHPRAELGTGEARGRPGAEPQR